MDEGKRPEKPIDKANVLSVYSGRPGCCCGCKGKHTYREDPDLRALGGRNRGYEVDDDEVNEAQVTRVVNELNENLDQVVEHDDFYVVEYLHRWYIAYKLDHAQKLDERKKKKHAA